jgi:hypothetical protein
MLMRLTVRGASRQTTLQIGGSYTDFVNEGWSDPLCSRFFALSWVLSKFSALLFEIT